MFSKAGVATKGTSGRSIHFRSTRPTRPSANVEAVVHRPPGLGILLVLAVCVQGCLAGSRATGRAPAAVGTANNSGSKSRTATNTPSPPGEALEPRLSAIRRELAAGEYTKAHQGLTVLAPHYEQLSPAQRREVKDDLCLTEYLIGEGSYPLSQQQRSCSEALAEPESASGAILARVHDAMKQSASAEVRGALDGQDLAAAEAAALAYRASPGADSQLLAGWSQDFWQVVHRRERSS